MQEKATVLLISAILVLGSFGLASGQAVYVDVTEIQGLVNGNILTLNPVDLVIPVRFTNVDEARSCISNGYKFTGEGVTWTGIVGEWNPAYPWDLDMAISLMQFPPFFDVGLWIYYFENGVGFAGLTNQGSSLPTDFDDIAYYITVEGVQGNVGDILTMDSTWWAPANIWLWCGEPTVYPSWGGPYHFLFDYHIPPTINSTPVTEVLLGSEYAYDVEAFSCWSIIYSLVTAPEGMVIDKATGLITWTPDATGDFEVEVAATNILGQDTQQFTIQVYQDAYTYCWPQPTYLKATENDRILEIRIYERYTDRVDPNSIVIQRKLEPLNDVRVEDGFIIAECRVFKFIGISGFRPIPPEGIQTTYSVEYLHASKGNVTLTGDFAVLVTSGDVTLDGTVDITDILFMADYFWGDGSKCEFEEFMDVDGNGQVDIRDALMVIEIVQM